MLPEFDERGLLPPGIHVCTFEELARRFGHGSPEREVEVRELRDFIDWCRSAGVSRVIVNGSFVTNKRVPIDVDIVLLPGPEYPRTEKLLVEGEIRWPFLQVLVARNEDDLEWFADDWFARHRAAAQKGIVEVQL